MGKQKQNAYQVFVKEEARRREKNGEFVNIASLFKELGNQWKEVPEERRQWYKAKAENWNNNPQPPSRTTYIKSPNTYNDNNSGDTKPGTSQESKPGLSKVDTKQDAQGDNYALVSRKRPHEDDEEEEDNYLMPRTEKRLKLGHGIPNWSKIRDSATASRRYKDLKLHGLLRNCREFIRDRERRLLNTPLYTFSVNVLCKVKKTNGFIPIEIGICAYQLSKGRITKPYNVIIDAGSPPTGHVGLALDHSQYHKIPLPPKGPYPDCARNDYRTIYTEILDYIKRGERTILVPSLKQMPQVVKSLEWLHEKATADGGSLPKVSTFTVFPIKEFILGMYSWVSTDMLHLPEDKRFCYAYWVAYQLELGNYDYDSSFMCNYHKIEENQTKFCAQSCATRLITDMEEILEEILDMYKHAIKNRETSSLSLASNPIASLNQPNTTERQTQINEPVEKPLAIKDI